MKRIASSSKLLTTSSFLLSVPGIYSYMYYGLYYPPLMLLTTSLISANYWRNALDDWRRYLDIYFARVSFSYFVGSTFYYVPPKINMSIGLPNLACILYCYYQSHKEYERGRYRWRYWHFGFHTIMTWQLFLTMNYMGKNYIKLKN